MLGLVVRILGSMILYSGAGVAGFVVDVSVFYTLVELMEANYLLATMLGFGIGLSVSFALARRYVFLHSPRPLFHAYALFFTVGLVGLLTITMLMFLSVSVLHFDPVLMRLLTGTLVGIASFFVHRHITFRAHVEHHGIRITTQ